MKHNVFELCTGLERQDSFVQEEPPNCRETPRDKPKDQHLVLRFGGASISQTRPEVLKHSLFEHVNTSRIPGPFWRKKDADPAQHFAARPPACAKRKQFPSGLFAANTQHTYIYIHHTNKRINLSLSLYIYIFFF